MNREMRDLLISWLTISVAFSLVLSRNFLNVFSFFEAFPIALAGVGTGFILHELAHKYVAIRYGARAEFRAWTIGLAFAIIIPLITFGNLLFAAPGAVYISGNVSRKQNGIISLAGPLTNILVGIVFLLLSVGAGYGFFYTLFSSVAMINLFLAAFNLIPIFPLDGSKVLAWNAVVWAVFFVPLAFLFFFSRLFF